MGMHSTTGRGGDKKWMEWGGVGRANLCNSGLIEGSLYCGSRLDKRRSCCSRHSWIQLMT